MTPIELEDPLQQTGVGLGFVAFQKFPGVGWIVFVARTFSMRSCWNLVVDAKHDRFVFVFVSFGIRRLLFAMASSVDSSTDPCRSSLRLTGTNAT